MFAFLDIFPTWSQTAEKKVKTIKAKPTDQGLLKTFQDQPRMIRFSLK